MKAVEAVKVAVKTMEVMAAVVEAEAEAVHEGLAAATMAAQAAAVRSTRRPPGRTACRGSARTEPDTANCSHVLKQTSLVALKWCNCTAN